jgi:hypothetical protein
VLQSGRSEPVQQTFGRPKRPSGAMVVQIAAPSISASAIAPESRSMPLPGSVLPSTVAIVGALPPSRQSSLCDPGGDIDESSHPE